jgi:hypothetical protein
MGMSFKISTPARWIVVVTDSVVMKELQDADESVLSMQAAADERNSTGYALSSTIHRNPYHMGIIKKNLTAQIYNSLPGVVKVLEKTFSDVSAIDDRWSRIDIHNLLLKCITAATNHVMVSGSLQDDQEYLQTLISLSTSVSQAGLHIDLAPRFLKKILARILFRRDGAMKLFLAKLGPAFEERRRLMREFGDDWSGKQVRAALFFWSAV